ncbi:hypothetical protein CDR68_23800 [Salmonella enterica]|nr:hypothetical protein [Salmonella enterica]
MASQRSILNSISGQPHHFDTIPAICLHSPTGFLATEDVIVMPTLYKALIFDMDGTLFNTEPLHRNAWREVFRQYKIERLDDEIIQFNGSSPENVATKIIQMNNLNANSLHIAAQKKTIVERMFNNEPINILPAALLLKKFHADYAIGLGTGSGASTAITLLLAKSQPPII